MRKRILWLSLLITVFGIIIYSLASTQVYYSTSVEQTKRIMPTLTNAYTREEFSADNDGAERFSQQLDGARVTIMDMAGNVLGESGGGDLPNHADRPEVQEAIKEGEGYAVRASQTVGKNMIYYCKAIDGILVRIAVGTDSEWALLLQSLPAILIYLLIDILGCLVFTYIATYYILRPIEKMTREATHGGEVKAPYPEFETVANVLNERNANIDLQMREINEEKQLVEKAQNSKNEFIANITHEMNTPLTSIKGYAELLASGLLTDGQKKAAYATINAQSERLTNLIACIINYNEIDSDELPAYSVDLSQLTREMIAAVKPEADKRNIEIIEKIEDNVTVESRHERMTQLVGNLLRNAIRYNKDGGTITVGLDYTHLSVEDTGIGIAPENMDKVFSRFFTVDKSHSGKNGGFGLGLAVCKKICTRAGWHIGVDSRQGEGSKFTVTF